MINKATLDLIKEFEGLRLTAYRDAVGVWTIGYGTTAAAGLGVTPKAGMTITEAEAEALLLKGLEKFAGSIRPKITAPINDNEFGAFLSLAYNIGPGAFSKSSALKKFNAGDKAGAANAILLWNKAGGKVLAGLTRRRGRERELFLTPVVTPKLTTNQVVSQKSPEVIHKQSNLRKTQTAQPKNADQDPIKKPGWLAMLIRVLAAIFKRKG